MEPIDIKSENILKQFNSISGIHDFVEVLNEIYKLYFPEGEKKLFRVGSINYYAFHAQKRYYTFDIPKKNGSTRRINAPVYQLKLLQQCINQLLHLIFKPHHTAHGFLLGRNVVTNAGIHAGKQEVLNVDLQDFFSSIKFRRVKAVLELPPFNLTGKKEKVAFLISNLCCNNGVLPQGAPTSPLLTNIVCQRLDRKLFQLAKTSKARYSRYADDITFSSNNAIFNDEFIKELNYQIENEGFLLNEAKTRIQDRRQRQEVTGLVVNKKVNINRDFIRKIRAIFHNYQKGGQKFAQKQFAKHWSKPITPPDFRSSLKGQIEYLGMVRGKSDSIYLKYKQTYLRLFSSNFIDYSFISHKGVRAQLELDYKRMEAARIRLTMSDEERFTEYCLTAAFQLEELVNYYLAQKMDFDKLVNELVTHTWATTSGLNGKNNVSEIPAVYKYFLFEKYFYYKPGVFYDSVITKLRNIRNQKLHRATVVQRSEEQILMEYKALMAKASNHKINSDGRVYQMSKSEARLNNEAKAVYFFREKNYKAVFEAVKDVSDKIRMDLAN
ncbi:RNA-directed DNA polymerase [Flavobacteriaceae bacterium TP-CH-4]|uniref:RNA-directed DNA polymerase n=1 Tax=Pelagihabitans pacificus TaxID=2696054 RepID=A0A967APU2_9FLAO|nr:reverse transcriptase domain-containing protein [Pelagihabitans pacificus]NHF58124.1 RNA-directed DNA polymerase [Pelagihabitans pacificus]